MSTPTATTAPPPKFASQYPENQQDWVSFIKWLVSFVQTTAAAQSAGNVALAAAQAAQATADTAVADAAAAQYTANQAGTSANSAGASGSTANTTANNAIVIGNNNTANLAIAFGELATLSADITAIQAVLTPGQTHVLPLGPLTVGGTVGSATFTGGIETAHVDPT